MSPLSTPKTKKARALHQRPLIDDPTAAELEGLFKVLANANRLRLLHALERVGELPVGELADAVGMSVQAVSNQLQRLVDQKILTARRDGNHVRYRIVDPCVTGLLDLGLCLIEENRTRRLDRHPPSAG